MRIDGRALAREILDELKKGDVPQISLAVVIVDADEAMVSFVAQKERVARDLGIDMCVYDLAGDISQSDLECQIQRLSDDESVGGIVVQLPLPKQYNRDAVISHIDYRKDIDALTSSAIVLAPSAGVVAYILERQHFSWENKKIAVVGNGFLVGQPVVRWLAHKTLEYPTLTVRVADISTKNLRRFVADADVVITGVGKRGIVDARWLKEGVGVIDFGIPADVDVSHADHLAFYTPTPGGTGPLLVAMLFRNFYCLNKSL